MTYHVSNCGVISSLGSKTHKETVGRANKRDNRFNRKLERRLKRQVLNIGRESRIEDDFRI
jgi:hypothetical protein